MGLCLRDHHLHHVLLQRRLLQLLSSLPFPPFTQRICRTRRALVTLPPLDLCHALGMLMTTPSGVGTRTILTSSIRIHPLLERWATMRYSRIYRILYRRTLARGRLPARFKRLPICQHVPHRSRRLLSPPFEVSTLFQTYFCSLALQWSSHVGWR